MLCSHIAHKDTFDLHGLILCVTGGLLCLMICVHTLNMETFFLHELNLRDFGDALSLLLCSHKAYTAMLAASSLWRQLMFVIIIYLIPFHINAKKKRLEMD